MRYIIGQPPLDHAALDAMTSLRCILNVESNLINNMPYDVLFARGIHVVTTGQVFAEPVAELGLALALNLARGIVDADLDFREGRERWGGDGNRSARLLSGAEVGIIGFGDLGKALNRVLAGFRCRTRVFDPWQPRSLLLDQGVEPADLQTVLAQSDFIFVVASVTSENQGFLNADAFAAMREGAAFILLSRAGVVDFDALIAAVASGHIVAASDVFPEEPLPLDHPVRTLNGFLRSAHRAGALDSAFFKMGDMVLEDLDLMDRGLRPCVASVPSARPFRACDRSPSPSTETPDENRRRRRQAAAVFVASSMVSGVGSAITSRSRLVSMMRRMAGSARMKASTQCGSNCEPARS